MLHVPCFGSFNKNLIQSGHAQIVPKEDVKNYLNTFTTLMQQTLKDYGISNLPDVDTKITYNVSKAYGYSLIGNLYFEDGFLMDIKNLVMFSRENTATTSEDMIRIICDMKFEGLSILRDFRYESKIIEPDHITDQSFGSIVITPANIQVNVEVMKFFENNTINVRCSNDFSGIQPGKKLLKFYPENGLTNRLKKYNLRPPVFSGLWNLWYPIFFNFLKDVTSKIEFPSVLYEF